MALILTTHGLFEEAALIKRDLLVETDHERTTAVEYCLASCGGRAHATEISDAPGHFCDRHVHRSVHVTLKEWPDGLGAILGDFK